MPRPWNVFWMTSESGPANRKTRKAESENAEAQSETVLPQSENAEGRIGKHEGSDRDARRAETTCAFGKLEKLRSLGPGPRALTGKIRRLGR